MLKALLERLRGDSRVRAPVVDVGDLAAQIAAETGVELETVARVLDLESELQEGVGLAHPPRATFVYYAETEFAGLAPEDGGDIERIAADAERLLNVPRAVALVVLEAETRYLQKRGIVGAG